MAVRRVFDSALLFGMRLQCIVRGMRTSIACPIIVLAVVALLSSCGGSKAPVPSILNVNNSTTPSSPEALPIEINGSGFQGAPGKVVFTQSGITATVTPNSSGWTDTGVVVTVPSGNGTSSFTVPGTVSVTVKTSGGTSNAVTLNLIQTLTFNVNNVTWATTTPLPAAMSGMRGVAVPGASSASAFVVVTGGFDGTSDLTSVYSDTLNSDGTVGGSWTSITTNPLPVTVAHHGMAEADPGNSLVATNSRFVYVLGGQQHSTDTPGGTSNIYMASVDPNTGAVGTWAQVSSNLPETLVGPAVSIFNGYIYVVGGLRADGTPSPNVYSAAVKPDGTLGSWATSANLNPTPVSFAQAFGFGGKLYVVDGEPGTSTDPNQQGNVGTSAVNFASAINGAVGAWTNTSGTIKSRMKHITWTAFGQVIAGEGIYAGSPGSLELERTVVQPDSTLGSWNGITSSVNQMNANVYNAATLVSPLQSPTATPRFLLFGGQAFTMTPPGALSNAVYYNNAP